MGSRYDEHDEDDFADLRPSRRGRRGRYECPHCGSPEEPFTRSEMSQAGLIMMIVMLIFCWPLFWIGFLMTENYQQCPDCGRRV